MSEKILVPALGESITEATVAKWLKNKGDNIEADESIVELETDKVSLEVPSPIKGVLEEIIVKSGETVEVGALLGSISENGVQAAQPEEKNKSSEKKESNIVSLEIDKKKDLSKIFDEEDNAKKPVE